MTTTCQNCRNTVETPWTLCAACRRDYARQLHRLRTDMQLLQRLARREYRLTDPTNGGKPQGGDAPLPINIHLADMLDEVESMLQDIWFDTGAPWTDKWQRLIPRMQTHLADLCQTPHAGQSLRSITKAIIRIENVPVDRRPRTRRIIGHCPECGREITAAKNELFRICETCGTLVRTDDIREQVRNNIDKYHLTRTPAGLSEWLRDNYGYEISRKQVRHWIERGKLPSTKPIGGGYYEFSIREVLANAMAFSKRE